MPGVTRAEDLEQELTIGELLTGIADQDQQAFDELYRRCSARVYGLVRRIVRDEQMSAETTQDVFLAIWQGGTARYNPGLGTGTSWLLTIAHRKAVDKVRLEENHRVRDLQWGIRHRSVDYDQVSETILTREDTDEIRAGLKNLSALQREAIYLAYYDGLTYNDVAAHLGIPASTAKTRIRDGIARLRSTLLSA